MEASAAQNSLGASSKPVMISSSFSPDRAQYSLNQYNWIQFHFRTLLSNTYSYARIIITQFKGRVQQIGFGTLCAPHWTLNRGHSSTFNFPMAFEQLTANFALQFSQLLKWPDRLDHGRLRSLPSLSPFIICSNGRHHRLWSPRNSRK